MRPHSKEVSLGQVGRRKVRALMGKVRGRGKSG